MVSSLRYPEPDAYFRGVMSVPFMLLLPLEAGKPPESHPALLSLLDHARQHGHPLIVESTVLDVSKDGERLMARLILKEAQPSPHAQDPSA
jgi:hypothetical protein